MDYHPPQAVTGVVDFIGRIACGADVANFLYARIFYGAGAFRVRSRVHPDSLLIIPEVLLQWEDWTLVISTMATLGLCQQSWRRP